MKANASRHSALSDGHALKLKQQLQAEVEQLLRLAETADASERREGMDIPQELARREQRLARIMRVQGQGFEQCYNAQLAVDRDSRLIVAPRVDPRGQRSGLRGARNPGCRT